MKHAAMWLSGFLVAISIGVGGFLVWSHVSSPAPWSEEEQQELLRECYHPVGGIERFIPSLGSRSLPAEQRRPYCHCCLQGLMQHYSLKELKCLQFRMNLDHYPPKPATLVRITTDCFEAELNREP